MAIRWPAAPCYERAVTFARRGAAHREAWAPAERGHDRMCGKAVNRHKPPGVISFMGEKHVPGHRPAAPQGRKPQPAWRARLAQLGGAAGGRPRWVLFTVLGVCVCLVIAGVTIAALTSGGGQAGHLAANGGSAAATSGATQPPAPQATTAPAKAKRVKANDGLTKSALRIPSRLERRIKRWQAGPGGAALAAVSQEMGIAAQSAGMRDYHQMKQACLMLSADISRARAAPPIPDLAMQRRYGRALAALARAAGECRQAISEDHEGDETVRVHLNKALLTRARFGLAAGSATLYDATAAIHNLQRG